MAELAKIRRGTDIPLNITLTDSGVPVEWNILDIQEVVMFSDGQQVAVEKMEYNVDAADPKILHALFSGKSQCYLGDYRVIIIATREGLRTPFDFPALTLVATTAESTGGDAGPVEPVTVEINGIVQSIDTGILQQIVDDCIAATDRANAAAEAVEQTNTAVEQAEALREAAEEQRQTDTARAISNANAATNAANTAAGNADAAAEEARAVVANALLKTQQTLTEAEQGQVQTNIGVKSTVDVVGAGEVQDVPLDIAQDNYLQTESGVPFQASGYFISKPFAVKRGDNIKGSVIAAKSTSVISEVDSNGIFITSLLMGEGSSSVKEYDYLANKDMYISFSCTKESFNFKNIPCKLAELLAEPAGGYNRKLYESYGAVYNEETGYYELNGFTDISEEEMWNIYRYFNFNDMTMFAGRYPQDETLKIRTNIPFQLSVQNSSNNSAFLIPHKWSYLGTSLKYVEKIVISRNPVDIFLCADSFIGTTYLFYDCRVLTEVEGVIDFSKYDGILTYVFINCPKLKSFRLKGLHVNANFRGSPFINLDTWTFMIENSTNTKSITITVTPEAYSYLTGAADPIPEVGGTKEEWMALVTTAQEKQISFVSA